MTRSIFMDVVKNEYDRLVDLIELYDSELEKLPKSKLLERRRIIKLKGQANDNLSDILRFYECIESSKGERV